MMDRLRLMLSGVWPTLIGLAIWLALVAIIGDTWPSRWYISPSPVPDQHRGSWLDLVIFGAAAVFLSIKSTIMLQRMGAFDRLTVALVAANFSFVFLYVYAVTRPLVPDMVNANPMADAVTAGALRVALLWTLLWGMWSLTNTRPIIIIDKKVKEIDQ